MVILDTDLIIGYLRKVPKAIEIISKFKQNGTELKTTIINAGELFKGAYLSKKIEENKKKIEAFLKNIIILDLKVEDKRSTRKFRLS